jgi:hypothetical protein
MEVVQCFLYGRPASCIFDYLINFNQSSISICSLQKCFFVKFKNFRKVLLKDLLLLPILRKLVSIDVLGAGMCGSCV